MPTQPTPRPTGPCFAVDVTVTAARRSGRLVLNGPYNFIHGDGPNEESLDGERTWESLKSPRRWLQRSTLGSGTNGILPGDDTAWVLILEEDPTHKLVAIPHDFPEDMNPPLEEKWLAIGDGSFSLIKVRIDCHLTGHPTQDPTQISPIPDSYSLVIWVCASAGPNLRS